MRLRLFAAIALLLLPGAAAAAGLRAVYVGALRPSLEIRADGNGDMDADLGDGRRLVVRGREAWVIEARLTGRIVNRLEDLAAIAPAPTVDPLVEPAAVARGPVTVRGRVGDGYDLSRGAVEGASPRFVMSRDPALRGLSAALAKVLQVQDILSTIEGGGYSRHYASSVAPVLALGAPLRLDGLELAFAEPLDAPLDPVAIAAEAESPEALQRRLAMEKGAEDEVVRDANIKRAFYGDGHVWLVTDEGKLLSIAEGGDALLSHTFRRPVAEGCRQGAPVVLTGRPGREGDWEIHRRLHGRWSLERKVTKEGDHLVGMACLPDRIVLLTDKRIIEIVGRRVEAVALRSPLGGRGVTSSLHVAEQHLFLGRNAGEWGGGMVRIDRRSGAVFPVERNATGDLCGGPLNTACDPVHAIAAIPWKPSCVAAAVGLNHFFSRGRMVEVCGKEVDQLFARPDDRYLDGDALEVARAGGFGSVAFYGLAALDDTLLAAGAGGLYRIGPDARAEHRPWPLFRNVGGVPVSFELPEAVLLVTTISGRVSLGRGQPVLVPR